MAKIIYQNENVLLLGNREAVCRPFDFGQWTEIRMGALISAVSNTTDSSSVTAESVSVLTANDKIYFGIKTSGSNFPGVSGTNFVGMASDVTSDQFQAVGGIYTMGKNSGGYSRLYYTAVSGSSTYLSYTNGGSNVAIGYPLITSGSDYNGFYGVKILLQNSGSANQSVAVYYKRADSAVGSGSADLHSQITSDSNWTTAPGTYSSSWAPGLPTPNSFFMYVPFYNNRIRISAMEVMKIT